MYYIIQSVCRRVEFETYNNVFYKLAFVFQKLNLYIIIIIRQFELLQISMYLIHYFTILGLFLCIFRRNANIMGKLNLFLTSNYYISHIYKIISKSIIDLQFPVNPSLLILFFQNDSKTILPKVVGRYQYRICFEWSVYIN